MSFKLNIIVSNLEGVSEALRDIFEAVKENKEIVESKNIDVGIQVKEEGVEEAVEESQKELTENTGE